MIKPAAAFSLAQTQRIVGGPDRGGRLATASYGWIRFLHSTPFMQDTEDDPCCETRDHHTIEQFSQRDDMPSYMTSAGSPQGWFKSCSHDLPVMRSV